MYCRAQPDHTQCAQTCLLPLPAVHLMLAHLCVPNSCHGSRYIASCIDSIALCRFSPLAAQGLPSQLENSYLPSIVHIPSLQLHHSAIIITESRKSVDTQQHCTNHLSLQPQINWFRSQISSFRQAGFLPFLTSAMLWSNWAYLPVRGSFQQGSFC